MPARKPYTSFAIGICCPAVTTGLLFVFSGWADKAHAGLVYETCVVVAASWGGASAAVVAAIASFFAWNYFFIPPLHTFVIQDPRDSLLLIVFLCVALLVGKITGQLRAREAEAGRLLREVASAEASREREHLRGVLFSSLSHDLKTPLSSLCATISNLLQKDVAWNQEKFQEDLKYAELDIERLRENIDEMLDLAKLESGQWKPQKDWYEFSEIVAHATRQFKEDDYKRLDLSATDGSANVYVDLLQIAQLLRHLLENALCYSPAASQVHLSNKVASGRLEFWVDDRGAGIPETERERVFEKFYRGKDSGRRLVQGAGLGLAICKEIVTYHQGRIGIAESPFGGARFEVTLPNGG